MRHGPVVRLPTFVHVICYPAITVSHKSLLGSRHTSVVSRSRCTSTIILHVLLLVVTRSGCTSTIILHVLLLLRRCTSRRTSINFWILLLLRRYQCTSIVIFQTLLMSRHTSTIISFCVWNVSMVGCKVRIHVVARSVLGVAVTGGVAATWALVHALVVNLITAQISLRIVPTLRHVKMLPV
jgi:hypothetical protein